MVQGNSFGEALMDSFLWAYTAPLLCPNSHNKLISCFQKVTYAHCLKKHPLWNQYFASHWLWLRKVLDKVLIWRWWWGEESPFFHASGIWSVADLLGAYDRPGIDICAEVYEFNILLCLVSAGNLGSPLSVLVYLDILCQRHSSNMFSEIVMYFLIRIWVIQIYAFVLKDTLQIWTFYCV